MIGLGGILERFDADWWEVGLCRHSSQRAKGVRDIYKNAQNQMSLTPLAVLIVSKGPFFDGIGSKLGSTVAQVLTQSSF